MSDLWIYPDKVFDGFALHTKSVVKVSGGRVTQLLKRTALAAESKVQEVKGIVTPGFVDLQINGGGGVLLNTTPTLAGMRSIALAHRKFGTVACLPTLISDTKETMAATVSEALTAMGESGIMGLHLEGPHIAPDRRGTHALAHLRPMDAFTLQAVEQLRDGGIPTLITVAPEAVTTAQISALAEMGAVVSLGHTNATAQMMVDAMNAGATAATHLYNAMSPMLGRAQGAVGAAINSQAYVGIICDGHHVSDEMVALAIRARPVDDRMVLVSDAMPTVGGDDHFTLYGQTISLQGGRLVNNEGSLAGAHTTQLQGVKRLVENTDTSLTTALRMAISNPANCMGNSALAQLTDRPVADVLLLDEQLSVATPLDSLLPLS